MNKEFIPYEQAVVLKQIGFTELCVACYDGSEMLSTYSTLFEPKNYNVGGGKNTSAPMYRQVFKWFRDEYDLFCLTDMNYNGKHNITWTIHFLSMNHGLEPTIIREEFKSYEEAELACVKTLIEIVKNRIDA